MATTFEAQLAILEHKNIICAGYGAVLHVHALVEEISVAVRNLLNCKVVLYLSLFSLYNTTLFIISLGAVASNR